MGLPHDVHIYIAELNNRIYYIFRHVFSIMGLRPILTNDKEAFLNCTTIKINYSAVRFYDEIYIKPQGMLYEKGIKHLNIKADYYKGVPVLFSNAEESDFPFDIFSAIFYLVTRYEEYLPFSPDKFGRFQHQESTSYTYKFIDEPIVEKWIELFKNFLKEKYKDIEYKQQTFKYIPTIDVDCAFAYRNKGFFLSMALIMRDILKRDFKQLIRRLKVMVHWNNDPFDNFDFLQNSLKKNGTDTIFFFLTGKRGRYDRNISLRKKAMKNLIQKVAEFADVGLHPSYESNKKFIHLEREKRNLEKVLNKQLIKSRQHFLKINFPKTYLNLSKTGIKEDFSMGYSLIPGFRAGTCTPYNFYDLTKEKEESELKIYPFQVMDTTFTTHFALTAAESEKKILEFYEKVRRVNGNFIMIWHNDTFSPTQEGQEWRKLFVKFLELQNLII